MQREAEEEQREEITAVALVGQVAEPVQRCLGKHGDRRRHGERAERALELRARPCKRAGQSEQSGRHDDPAGGVGEHERVAPDGRDVDEMERGRRLLVVAEPAGKPDGCGEREPAHDDPLLANTPQQHGGGEIGEQQYRELHARERGEQCEREKRALRAPRGLRERDRAGCDRGDEEWISEGLGEHPARVADVRDRDGECGGGER